VGLTSAYLVPMGLLMRYLVAAIVVGLTIWLLVPRAVLLIASNPRPPVVDASASLAKAEERRSQAVQNAVGAGKLHEDPQRHALRQAVLNAANRVEASPCDTRQRRALSEAFDIYSRHMTATADDRVETLTLQDGSVIDVSHHFDEPVEDAMRFALTSPCEN
jgi:hypothetical protein